MSFLETLTDKPAVVIDIGHAYTKCGFSGEYAPKHIIKSEFIKNGKLKNIFVCKTENELKENLIEFIYYIYYKLLNINSRERKVVICESILNNSKFRQCLTDILFNNYQIISIFYIPTHLSSIFTLGINTAIIIDCGYIDTQIVPIADYYLLYGLLDTINVSSKQIHNHIKQLLIDLSYITINGVKEKFKDYLNNSNNDNNIENVLLNEDIIEDIKIKCCFITTRKRSIELNNEYNYNNPYSVDNKQFSLAHDYDYNLPNNVKLHIPGYIREFALDILFSDDCDNQQTLQYLLVSTLFKCPIDLRKCLSENVVFIGGTCMINGFYQRLISELDYLVENKEYKDKLNNYKFKFHKSPSLSNYTSWLGASILSSLDLIDSLSIQMSKYKQDSKIVDWFIID